MRLNLLLATVLVLVPLTAAKKPKSDSLAPTAPTVPTAGSTPLAPLATPSGPSTTGTNRWTRPVDLRLLVLTGSGSEPSFAAIRFFLDHIGIPYDAVAISQRSLPALSDSSRGFYQGIILATGNLYHLNAAGQAASLSPEAWLAIDDYMRNFGVRLVSFYSWPEPRYGLAPVSVMAASATPLPIRLTTAGQAIFPYLKPTNTIPAPYSAAYMAAPAPAAGEVTTPLLTVNGHTVGAYHRKADNREYLALTVDHNPYVMHSMALHYGLFNWVTRGIFLGFRRVYLSPQNDDLFLASDQFIINDPNCQPVGAATDPTFDPSSHCVDVRMTDHDLRGLRDWQAQLQRNKQTEAFVVSHAFNGFGTLPESGADPNDRLTRESRALRNEFFWVSHTFDHENLDCFNPVPNSSQCTPATYAQAAWEIRENLKIAAFLGLPIDKLSMVTPGISGLRNVNFLRAARDNGIRYLVSDMSRPDWMPATPNTGVWSPYEPSIFLIPRRATNIFYNTSTPVSGAWGSQTDEFNFLFGPNGYFVDGYGRPFFQSNLSYEQILNWESDQLVSYMLRGEFYPVMFHQANFIRYNGRNTLFTDLIDATVKKFAAITSLPIASMTQAATAQKLIERMNYLKAGVTARFVPGTGIVITARSTASVPLTGACWGKCETYAGQQQSSVPVAAGQTAIVPFF